MATQTTLSHIRTKPAADGGRISFRRASHEAPPPADASSDVYYRSNPLGVPFLWEIQPGTPKIKSQEFPIPPLTPPPSFHSSPGIPRRKHGGPTSALILPRLSLNRKAQFQRSPSSRSSSSSLSSPPWSASPSPSPFRTPNESKQRRMRSAPPRVSCDSRTEEESDDQFESPVSTLCFGGSAGRGGEGRRRGCSFGIMKLVMGDF